MQNSLADGFALELMTYFGFTLNELVEATDTQKPSLVVIAKKLLDNELQICKIGGERFNVHLIYTRTMADRSVRAHLHAFWDGPTNKWRYLLTQFDGTADLTRMNPMIDETNMLTVQQFHFRHMGCPETVPYDFYYHA